MQKANRIITFIVLSLLALNVASYFSFKYTAITWTRVIIYALVGILLTSLLIFLLLSRLKPSRRTGEKSGGSLLLGFIVFTFLLFYIPFGLNDWFSSYQGTYTITETNSEKEMHTKQGHTWETTSASFCWKGHTFSILNKTGKPVKAITFDEHKGLFGMMILKRVMLHE